MNSLLLSRLRQGVPHLFTFLNLACGYFLVTRLLPGAPLASWESVHYFLWLAALFDFLDGFFARRLGVVSAFGKQLDALSDLLTFGVVPALCYFRLFHQNDLSAWAPFSFFIVGAAACRLAMFAAKEAPQSFFVGLPTPIHALFVSALPAGPYAWYELLSLLFLGGFFMMSRLPFLSFRSLPLSGYRAVLMVALLFSLLSLIFLGLLSFVYVMLAYVGTSVFVLLLKKGRKRA